MNIKREYLEELMATAQKAADQHKNDALANQGAADVLRKVLDDLDKANAWESI